MNRCALIVLLCSAPAWGQDLKPPAAAGQLQVEAAKPADAAPPTEPQPAVPAAEEPKPEDQPPKPPVVTTIQGERITAVLGVLADGKLSLATDPPRTLALDELDRIEFGAGSTLSLEWIGQDNSDLAQVGSAAGGNGIQDIHLRLGGLLPQRQVKQIIAVSRYASVFQRLFKQEFRVWRLDTSQSPHWRLALARGENNRAPTAELYLEPDAADAFQQEFSLTVTFDDGTSTKVSALATTHTSDKLKVGKSESPQPMPAAEPTATVFLEGGDVLHGRLSALGEDQLTLATAWQAELKVPLLHVLAIRLATVTAAEAQAQFDKQRGQPGSEDMALVAGADGAVAQIAGSAKGLADGKLQFEFDGEVRSINLAKLAGLVFASHPAVRSAVASNQVFRLTSGDVISGTWKGLTEDEFEVQTAWQAPVKIARSAVLDIALRNGRMVYLSDLEPVGVEEIPYFGRRMPYRRDQSLSGDPLRMKGKDYPKGLAVHSRSLLTYAIDGQFETFKAVVGFDEIAGGRGRVDLRVLADGKEVFARPKFRGDEEPLAIDVSIAGTKQLSLEVDFGENEDIGDRVIWAEARLFRKAQQ